MGIKLYVGNLSYGVQSEDLNEFFAQYGAVTSAKLLLTEKQEEAKVSDLLKWKMKLKAVQLLIKVMVKTLMEETLKLPKLNLKKLVDLVLVDSTKVTEAVVLLVDQNVGN